MEEKISIHNILETQAEERRQNERKNRIAKERLEIENRLAKTYTGYVHTCVLCSQTFMSSLKDVNICQKCKI